MMIFLPWSVMDPVEAQGQRMVARRVAGFAHNPLSLFAGIAPACRPALTSVSGAVNKEPC
ncbi:hypothetical protein NO263_08915 [Gluconacetobacter entanii]|uniref:Uncharacterized protein n=1 Tax=Gluconacetobacter entanii TaxID=108528 RepID=A0ABT3K5K3_9PROT|nr:hypothetical protein [Gluconacetobacter entanii]MCW4590700.1 hypothetical protein [Gluconacetobacter entanii]MCW4593249.1 hypothetical protein [Gluconacetobacter entanii]NPC89066.1 hypothetical protein [Gluconacetobacter entanii]